MIKCTVCLAENDDFATTCVQCKAFLQDRVPNLNLFETGWQVIESPSKAFRNIALAEHKNYVLFLFSLFGVSVSFAVFWYYRLGSKFASLLDLIPGAVGIGIVIGLASLVLVSGVYHLLCRMVGGLAGFRSSVALLGYSMTPVALSLVFILPIELMTFGMYLFTGNPDPYMMKPVSYILLIGFDGLLAVWTLLLAVAAARVGHQITTVRACCVVALTVIVFVGALALVAHEMHFTVHV
jgi:hypothetical protein